MFSYYYDVGQTGYRRHAHFSEPQPHHRRSAESVDEICRLLRHCRLVYKKSQSEALEFLRRATPSLPSRPTSELPRRGRTTQREPTSTSVPKTRVPRPRSGSVRSSGLLLKPDRPRMSVDMVPILRL